MAPRATGAKLTAAKKRNKPGPTPKSAKMKSKTKSKFEKDGKVRGEDTVPIFRTFSASEKLDSGLCLLRKLGEGKYEIIHLEKVSYDMMNSKEAQQELKTVPERGALLRDAEDQFAAAFETCNLAMRIASDDIFPFQKLPIELRCKIYELVLGPPRTVRKYVHPIDRRRNTHLGNPPPPPERFAGCGLMQSCRQFYQEMMPIFWRINEFGIDDLSLFKAKFNRSFTANVQNVSFFWTGYVKDGDVFRAFSKCPKLKSLKLYYDKYSITYPATWYHRNMLYQGEDDAKVFCAANGFDKLMQIRGLEQVTLVRKPIADEAARRFEGFLMRILTQPREVGATSSRTGKAVA